MDINLTNLNTKLSYSDRIRNSIKNIVFSTKQDILYNDPLFGANLYKYIGKPLDTFTVEYIKKDIKNAIYIYENRVESVNVSVVSNEEYGSIIITIQYVESRTKEEQQLVLNYNLGV